jgi:DNA invertase Pin-like site-specific DNA recombinase
MNLSVAIYVRVSTSHQDTGLQVTDLRRYCEVRGWHNICLFEDVATGTNGNRPALKQLLVQVREGRFHIVLIWKLDRLFRSLQELLAAIQELSALQVSLVSLKDQIDMTTPSGKLLVHMIGAFAEFEASLIKERVLSGLAKAKANGKRLGRPPSVDHAQVLKLRESGHSYSQIANTLKISKGAVSKSLRKTAFKNPTQVVETIESGEPPPNRSTIKSFVND